MSPATASHYAKILHSLLDVDRIQFRDTLAELLKSVTPLEVVENHITPILQQIGSCRGRRQTQTSDLEYLVQRHGCHAARGRDCRGHAIGFNQPPNLHQGFGRRHFSRQTKFDL